MAKDKGLKQFRRDYGGGVALVGYVNEDYHVELKYKGGPYRGVSFQVDELADLICWLIQAREYVDREDGKNGCSRFNAR